MKQIFLALLVTGCMIDPPAVTGLTPPSGDFGTTVTITGTGFGSAGTLEFSGIPGEGSGRAAVTSWSDTQIRARVPFPSTAGAIHVVAATGETDTPVFTPETPWTIGDAATTSTLVTAQRFGTATVVIALDPASQVQLISFGATTATYMLDGITGSTDRRTPTRAKLVAADQVLASNTLDKLIAYTVANGAVTATDTGMTGTLLAADPHGAWLLAYDGMHYQLSHALPGTPWTIDRGPLQVPHILDAQLAADGTLVVAYSHDDGDIFDNMANVGIARLAPAATALSTAEYPEMMAWDDYIASAQLQLAADGARMVVAYSTQEYDQQVDVTRPTLARASTGAWTPAQGLESTGAPLAFTESSIAALDDSGGDLAIIPDLGLPATTQPVPFWPAGAAALVSDGTTLLPVIVLGDRVWAPSPPR